jgi:Glycosyl transferases group 1
MSSGWIGDADLANRVGRLARASTGTRIVLPGERSDEVDVLPALDVFSLPSRYEGLPTAIVEAMIWRRASVTASLPCVVP